MYSDEAVPISFPGLGHLQLWVHRIAFSIGPVSVHWYGIIIAVGLVLALLYGAKRAKEFGVTVDDLTDVVLWSVIFGIIGARLYYVIFYSTNSDYFTSSPLNIFYIWDGGLAIYGGIIGAFCAALVTCRIKMLNPLPFFDLAGLGFLIGQGIGRWGNFVNREAYGSQTNLPWRMVVDSSGTGYHPCFLYESLWCLLGFLLLHLYSKRRKFKGELFLMYVAWYSFGRFFIEGLRTDSLMIGPLRVSQLLSALAFVAAAGTLAFAYYRRHALAREDAKPFVPLYADAIAEEAKEEQKKQEAAEKDDDETDSAESAPNDSTGTSEKNNQTEQTDPDDKTEES